MNLIFLPMREKAEWTGCHSQLKRLIAMSNPDLNKYPFKQYVWALGDKVSEFPIAQVVDRRYQVVAPCVWLDTQASEGIPPDLPEAIPEVVKPYLQAYPYTLHVPTVYSLCHNDDGEPIILLNNIPVDRGGKLLPPLHQVWEKTTPFRQIYWCWQMLTLWQPLCELKVANSLLNAQNIRVEGWRIRLVALIHDAKPPSLADLAAFWQTLLASAHPGVAAGLQTVCHQIQSVALDPNADGNEVLDVLNRFLLEQATTITSQLQIAGDTNAGPQQPRNEDACFPSRTEFQRTSPSDLPFLPRLGIVCDGVGGHAGGEIASQIVVRSLQLQLKGLLVEASEQTTPMPPALVIEQIEAAIRVANNLVATQNDTQGRSERQRMGTTLVLALMLPQRLLRGSTYEEVNELYIAHVGDSRAYWITPEYCHQLTLDDDITHREVSAGRAFLSVARARSDAGSLTQAIGTRTSDYLKPHIQRFILDEDGVILLCSDGLSDNRRVEESWANYIGLIVKNIVPLNAAVDSWIELANQRNGNDNVAVVLLGHQATTGAPTPLEVGRLVNRQDNMPTELTEASKVLLYGEPDDEVLTPTAAEDKPRWPWKLTWPWLLFILVLLGTVGVAGYFAWRTVKNAPGQNSPAQNAPEPVPTLTEPN
jgi:protein phosphatase